MINKQTLILVAYSRKALAAFLRAADKEPVFMQQKKKVVMRRSFSKILRLLLKDAPANSRASRHQDEMADDICTVVAFAISNNDNERKEFANGMRGQEPSKIRRYIVDKLLDHYLEDLPPTSEIIVNRHQLLDELMLMVEMILLDERSRDAKKLLKQAREMNEQIHNRPVEEAAQ